MSKKITWVVSTIPAQGFMLLSYLNEHNFQPGKFFVIFDGLNYQVFYVYKEGK